ncbi:MAG: hypothetical protein KDD34_08255 [Bdellovibrionales bacterium]|nr:hypothetical protein [Bdellovibrionales bacterium]
MKQLISITLFMFSFHAFAYQYCGNLNSIRVETGDGWDIIRMSLYNGKSEPKSIVIQDTNAIEKSIQKITADPSYKVYEKNFDWYWKNTPQNKRYFICVNGSELHQYRDKFFMDNVTQVRIWSNNKEL